MRLPRLPLVPDLLRRGPVPADLAAVTSYGTEAEPAAAGMSREGIDHIWEGVRDVYSGGAHPAIQVCVRRRGHVVLNRAIGYARGNGPGDDPDEQKVLATPDTPFVLYSASKAVTAMVVHLLDQRGQLHIGDPVAEYFPEFARHGKGGITIGHILSHRAGIPIHPTEITSLDYVNDRRTIVEALADARPQAKPGRVQAYHALSGGAVVAEVVERVTGSTIREVLGAEILEPLGFRWGNYGVAEADLSSVARNYLTGLPSPPPISTALNRLLGTNVRDVVAMSNDPRFLTAIVPAGNIVSTADELSRFYELLRNDGELDGVRIFDPRTIRRAVKKQSYQPVDFTLGFPIGYSYGFMLGGKYLSLFGPDTENAYGHLGFTFIFGWADPRRELAVGVATSGKPVLYPEVLGLLGVLGRIGTAAMELE